MQRLEIRSIVRDTSLLGVLCAVGVLAPVAVGHAVGAKDPAELQQQDKAALETAVETRRDAIDHEIARSAGHPWAADYYEGDGLGANIRLSIAPRTGVAATWHGCLGLYGANLGAVFPEQGGALRLDFEQPNAARFGGFPDRLVPVQWGARRYLIKPGETTDFVAAIQSGLEPRTQSWGRFLLADGDELKPVSGLPNLPAPDRARIRLRAVGAEILEVGEPQRTEKTDGLCYARYPVRLSVDGDGLLNPGEKLERLDRSSALTDIAVRDASPGIASGVAEVFEVDCGKPNQDDTPSIGWRLTTGAYDEASANRDIARARQGRSR